MRIWTYNVRSPLDLPWRGEGYPTRWLHEYVCDLFKIQGKGTFLPSSGASEEQVQHLLFVPRSAVAGPQPRYWLLHIEDRACVVPGQHPFDWDIVAQHIQDLYAGLRIPPTRPALGIQSQLFLPDYPLPELVTGSVIQILLGALHMETSRDVWEPAPWAVPGPFFQFVPSRGPAGEPARVYAPETGPERGPAPPVSCQEVGCQTEVELRVATHLLTSSTVQNLALQLHGLADCLQELPCNTSYLNPTFSPPVPLFQGPPSADSEEVPAGASPDFPASEPGPSLSGAAAEEDPEETHSGSVSGFTVHFGWGACFTWAVSLKPSWGVWCLLGHRLAFPVTCSGSIISPPGSESDGDGGSASQLESVDDDENLLGDTPDGLRPGDGLHTRPAGPPPPLPVGSPPPPDFYGANLIANASAPA